MKFKTENTTILSILFLSFILGSFCLNLKEKQSGHEFILKKEDLNEENFNINEVILHGTSQCNYINCGETYGHCMNKNTCRCKEGFVHAPYLSKNIQEFCRYKQRSQLICFILELFFLCGAGHFYCMRVITGFLKLIFAYTVYITYDYLKKEDDSETSLKRGCLKYVGYLVVFSFFVVHFYDILMIGQNKYLDGYGIPLEKFKY